MGNQIKVMRLRRPDSCAQCGTSVSAGTRAGWDRINRLVVCSPCLPHNRPVSDIEVSLPGASLDWEYQRRSQARETRVKAKHPKIGGLLLALTDVPASTRSFAIGAEGERMIAARLEK